MLWLRHFDRPSVAIGLFLALLHDSSSQFKSFVQGVFELPCIEDLLLEGPGQRQIYKARPLVFSGCPSFKMSALRVDFR